LFKILSTFRIKAVGIIAIPAAPGYIPSVAPFYKLLLMASCVLSVPKLRKQAIKAKRLLGGRIGTRRLPSLL